MRLAAIARIAGSCHEIIRHRSASSWS